MLEWFDSAGNDGDIEGTAKEAGLKPLY